MSFNDTYLSYLQNPNPKEVFYTVEIGFAVPLYLTNSVNAKYPDGANVILGCLKIGNGISQKVDTRNGSSSIGDYNFEAIDTNGDLTTQLQLKYAAGEGVRHKDCKVYKGYDDMDFVDYEPEVSYIIEDLSQNKFSYTFRLNDRQREARKNIFTKAKTTLSKTITAEQTHIPVTSASISNFETVAHDAQYTEHPSQTVRYIKIEKEVIACDGNNAYVDPTDGLSFVIIQRGAFGTIAIGHEVDSSKPPDKRPEISEFIYLEGTFLKLLYAILTGVLHGQGSNLPRTWHLGIDTIYVVLSDFTSHPDLWDTTTNTGRGGRFADYEEIEGYEFFRKEILPIIAGFMPVGNDGRIGFKRLQPLLRNSGYKAELNNSNIITFSQLEMSQKDIANIFRVKWHWDFDSGKFLQDNVLLDSVSITKHKVANKIEYEFKGIHTGKNTLEDIINIFESFRDHYSNDPYLATVKCLPSAGYLQVGDTVRVKTDKYRDKEIDADLDRVFEIHGKSTNKYGEPTFKLFASTGAVSPLSRTADSFVMDDAFYNVGTDLTTVLTIIGGVVTVDGNIPGAATMAAGIYYYDGNLEIPFGRIVTFNNNVQLRIKGFLTVNGSLDGKGRGHLGGVASVTPGAGGISGYIGNSKSEAGLYARIFFTLLNGGNPENYIHKITDWGGPTVTPWNPTALSVEGQNASVPYFNIINKTTSIEGLPEGDLRATSGSAGATTFESFDPIYDPPIDPQILGGNGGAGGAALITICRGMSFGSSGEIVTSGDDGLPGVNGTLGTNKLVPGKYYGGSGGGGQPSPFILFMDGNHALPDITKHKAISGLSPIQGTKLGTFLFAGVFGGGNLPGIVVPPLATGGYSASVLSGGKPSVDYAESARRVQYIPPVANPVVVQPETKYKLQPLPSLTLLSDATTLLIRGDNSVDERVKVTHITSTDSQAIGYEIQAKKTAASIWRSLAFSNDVNDTEHFISGDEGESYDFRGRVLADATALNSDWTTPQTHVVVGVSDLGAMATPTGVTVDSGTAQLLVQNDGTIVERMLIQWDLPTDPLLTGTEIEYKLSTDTVYTTAPSINTTNINSQYITGVGGFTYDIRIKHLSRTKPHSAYFSVAHLLLGKTEPPASVPWFNIDGNTFTWGTISDADLKGYKIRFHYGNVTTYSDATPLHDGYLTSSPQTIDNLPTGTGQITYLINSFDTGDRQGLTPAIILAGLGDPFIENVVQTQDEHSGGFTGTKVNGAVDIGTGDLEANSVTQFYHDNGNSPIFPLVGSTQFFPTDLFAEMTYTFNFSPSVNAAAIIEFTIAASSYKLQYKLSTNPDYVTWPGRVDMLSANTYNIRITTASSTTQGIISALSVTADLPDIVERINDFVVASIGVVRFTLTKAYTAIDNVSLTLQEDGNGADNVRLLDKQANSGAGGGPSIQTLTGTTRVTGLVDAIIKGH